MTALSINDAQQRKKVIQILIDLLRNQDGVAQESRAIINYNIAKLFKIEGNAAEEKAHLKEAKKLAPELIDARLKIDPFLK